MSINARIMAALAPLKIPTYFLESPTSAVAPYVMFQTYNEEDSDYQDDVSTSEISYVNMSFWYKKPSDFSKAKAIKTAMKDAGFIFDGGKDMKDSAENLFGKELDFIYKEFN